MPPSSRKRNKGKDRKAKQQAKKEETERLDAHRFWRGIYSNIECNHGCASTSDDHPVSSFMDQYFVNSLTHKMSTGQNLGILFETHKQVWTNASYRKLARDILIRTATNVLLREDSSILWSLSLYSAQALLILEHYNGTDDVNNIGSVFSLRVVRTKGRDLNCYDYDISGSGRRDALKFYRKRISCQCLKKMHLEARKTIPKMGLCDHCKTEKERVSLSVCSECMIGQYCSRKCQVAHWPVHKGKCDILTRDHKLHMKEQSCSGPQKDK